MDALTERIREASDILDVIGQHVTLTKSGRVHRARCPFHQEKTPSFTVWADRQIFKCFGCGVGGDVFKFVQLKENLPFPDAKRWLADRAGIPVSDFRGAPAADGKTQLSTINRWAADWFQKNLTHPKIGAAAAAYLQRRKISHASSEQFQIGYAPAGYDNLLSAARRDRVDREALIAAGLVRVNDRGNAYDVFRDRLMFPICDAGGRVVGFGGRAMSSDEPAKYINTAETPLFHKSRQLYGVDRARTAFSERKRAIVVEGYTDCIMAHQFGLTDVVATLGTAFTRTHGEALRRFVDTVYLVFDGDAAGIAAADRALDVALGCRLDVRIVILSDGADPCDFLLAEGAEAMAAKLISADPALEFKWKQVEGACREGGTPAARREAIDHLIDTVFSLSATRTLDDIDRGDLLGRVGRLVGLSPAEVHSFAARRAARGSRDTSERTARRTADAMAAEQRIYRELLEILICSPADFGPAEEKFSPAQIHDDRLRRVADACFECYTEAPAFSSSDVLARLDDADLGGLVVELAMEGANKGNFTSRIEQALGRLEQIWVTEETREDARRVANELSTDPTNRDDVLRGVSARFSEHRGFAPPKSIRGSSRPAAEIADRQ